MPNGNGMGPAGAGPKTGRGLGYCTGNPVPGWQAAGGGRGMGRGMRCGAGRGFGRGFFAGNGVAPSVSEPVNDSAALRDELEALRMQVAALGRQLAAQKDGE
ncbi:MAG: DUF5320 domain-containing protein [Pontiellaceae bacterium]|nr:DUF5320 domain-containing protein [Pontiellaceae bacterium]